MPRPKKRSNSLKFFLFLVFVIGLYAAWASLRPLAPVPPSSASLHLQSSSLSGPLAWPGQGQAAVGINPSGVLATHGEQKPVPIASTAKVLTALAVLKKRPLAAHQSGPRIQISAADVAIYNQYVANDGSVTAVQVGEELTEYQMLQAILLPSANNIADSLAIWAFGSLDNYAAFTNNYMRQLGLTHTHIGSDASGYDASTVSTAHDLVLVGEAAMQEPALAEIVGQTSAELPFAGRVQNVNALVGTNGIVGVKTGNTDQAGGVFLAAKQTSVQGKPLILVSAVVGTDTLQEAMTTSLPLLASSERNFATTQVLPRGAMVGFYPLPWGGQVAAAISKPLTALIWKGSSFPTEVQLQPIAGRAVAGQTVGSVQIPQSTVGPAQSVPVQLQTTVPKPSVWWRLLHPR